MKHIPKNLIQDLEGALQIQKALDLARVAFGVPRWILGLGVGVVIAALGAVLSLTPVGADFEKHLGLKWLFQMRGAIEPPADVAVVAINSSAAGRMNLPSHPRDWPRSIHGQLVEKLTARGVKAIVFDVNFTRSRNREHEKQLAAIVNKSGRVVLVEILTGKRQPVFDAGGKQSGMIWTEQLLSPVAPLDTAAKGLGPFPLPKVQVNVFQFWAFKPSVGDAATMPGVAFQIKALSAYSHWLNALKDAGYEGVDRLPADATRIRNAQDMRTMMVSLRRAFQDDPALRDRIDSLSRTVTDSSAEADTLRALAAFYGGTDNRFLNFYGPPGTIPNIPYDSVINDTANNSTLPDLKDKVVFVGYSDLYDPGQPDRFYTVFTRDDGVDLSGVEIAATAYGNLSTNRAIKPAFGLASILVLTLFGLVLGSGIYMLTAVYAVPVALGITYGYVKLAQHLFDTAEIWSPLATPVLVQLPLALLVGLSAQYMYERKLQQRFSKAVSYYLPQNVIQELTEGEINPDSLNKVVYGICLATDMSGFSGISQQMSPKELAQFMNSYFDALAETLKRYHVDVTEFHADTIMCAWTGDKAEDMNRGNALRAALAVVNTVEHFDAQTPGYNLNARIGLDEGSFFLGHTGGGGRMGYSILGDCANTASRLEGLNKHMGTHVLSSAAVATDHDGLLLRPLGWFVLKGMAEAVPVSEVFGDQNSASPNQIRLWERFAAALQMFDKHHWKNAATAFETLLQDFPKDGPSRFYYSLCQQYLQQAPQRDDPQIVHMQEK